MSYIEDVGNSLCWAIELPKDMDDSEAYKGLLFMEPRDEYDKCVIGVVERFNDRFVLYSKSCVMAALAADFGTDPENDSIYEDAVEWYEFNMRGAFVGEHTPGFLEDEDD